MGVSGVLVGVPASSLNQISVVSKVCGAGAGVYDMLASSDSPVPGVQLRSDQR